MNSKGTFYLTVLALGVFAYIFFFERHTFDTEQRAERKMKLFPDFDAAKESAYRDVLEAKFPEMKGAADLIAALHGAGFKLAIGSSGPRGPVGCRPRPRASSRRAPVPGAGPVRKRTAFQSWSNSRCHQLAQLLQAAVQEAGRRRICPAETSRGFR